MSIRRISLLRYLREHMIEFVFVVTTLISFIAVFYSLAFFTDIEDLQLLGFILSSTVIGSLLVLFIAGLYLCYRYNTRRANKWEA